MPAKKSASSAPVLFTPIGTFRHAYLERPDDKPVEGASWKPDGKYKTKLVLDAAPAELLETIRAFAREKFGEAYPGDDELRTPIVEADEDDEELAGKFILHAKSKFAPEGFDARGKKLPRGVHGRGGDRGPIKIILGTYEKDEQVREGKKTVTVKTYGVMARLLGYQIVEKGQGGGGSGGFGAVEGGYEASAEDAAARDDSRGDRGDDQGDGESDTGRGRGDF